MNRKSVVSLGPGASSLILIFVTLALAVLSMLSLMSARTDVKFSERSAAVIEAVYQLSESAEENRAMAERLLSECAADAASEAEYLAAIGNVLPDNMELYDNEISWTERIGIRSLYCTLRVTDLAEPCRTEWIRHDLVTELENEAIERLDTAVEVRRSEVEQLLADAAAAASSEEAYRAAIPSVLPEDMQIYEDLIFWTETDEDQQMDCVLRVTALTDIYRTEWVRRELVDGSEEEWD